ncbi:hypothetical protein [Actinomadura madurae]|uniref:hypothetical protein n=1 Tax=Actinomadura madurae TaxID=1993 RepID=UPI0020D24829|nr:hypothetical protein [Actinomadura madurae]MCQ0012816.1 hypothetical protein [Actinomadura madurae]
MTDVLELLGIGQSPQRRDPPAGDLHGVEPDQLAAAVGREGGRPFTSMIENASGRRSPICLIASTAMRSAPRTGLRAAVTLPPPSAT